MHTGGGVTAAARASAASAQTGVRFVSVNGRAGTPTAPEATAAAAASASSRASGALESGTMLSRGQLACLSALERLQQLAEIKKCQVDENQALPHHAIELCESARVAKAKMAI